MEVGREKLEGLDRHTHTVAVLWFNHQVMPDPLRPMDCSMPGFPHAAIYKIED